MPDLTYADALAQMGLTPDTIDAERALVAIPRGGKPIHRTATEMADKPLARNQQYDQYVTLAMYAPGSIHRGGGRTSENAVSCDAFMFDADLKDYFQMTHEQLQQLPHDELDQMIQALVIEAQEVFARVGIPIHRVVCTGYGIAIYSDIHPDDRHRTADISDVHKRLVARVNAEGGRTLVDPSVSDPLSRIMRLVGSLNHKGPIPREVYTLWTSDAGGTRLADLPVEATPVRRAPARPISEKRLSEETVDEIVLCLSAEYHAGSRNSIAFGLPAMLYKAGVPRDQAHDIIGALGVDDEERDNRADAVERTYDHGESGHPVTGYRYLGNFLSPRVQDVLARNLTRFKQSVVVEGIEEEAPLAGATLHSYDTIYDPAPAESFYGLAGEYRNLVAPCTSGPDAFHLASFLTYAGVSLGRRAWTYQARKHVPALYTILIGDTGSSKKDTCADLARHFFARQDGPVVTPSSYAVLEGVSTPEGLLAWMSANTPNVMIHTSEFDSLLTKAASEPGHGLVPMLTRVWDGKEHEDLPTRTNPLRVDRPWVSLLSSTTPDTLRSEINPGYIRSGFANRVLWVFGSGKGRIADPPKVDEYAARLLISEVHANLNQAAPKGQETEFTRDPLARQRFDQWDADLYDQAHYLNPDERHLAQRLESQAVRIATIFAALDGVHVITNFHLDAAITFVEWQFENLRREARLWGSNDDAKLSEAIMQLIRTGSKSHREVVEALPRWGAYLLNRTINSLIEAELVVMDSITHRYSAA